MKAKFQRAFTLAEILIVVAVIALIAAIAIPNMVKARALANDSMAESTLTAVAKVMEQYRVSHDSYPTEMSDLTNVPPPYLNKDYSSGTYYGFSFVSTLGAGGYSLQANPVTPGVTGTKAYTVTTGGKISEEPATP